MLNYYILRIMSTQALWLFEISDTIILEHRLYKIYALQLNKHEKRVGNIYHQLFV